MEYDSDNLELWAAALGSGVPETPMFNPIGLGTWKNVLQFAVPLFELDEHNKTYSSINVRFFYKTMPIIRIEKW